MKDSEFQAGLAELRRDWGGVSVDPERPGILRATNDPMTGLLVGRLAPLLAEIINRAIKEGAPCGADDSSPEA